jgi:hypothetical protein
MANRLRLTPALLVIGAILCASGLALSLDPQNASTGAVAQDHPLAPESFEDKQILPPLGIHLKVTTRMVVVDVLALDKKERPVDGLTAGDFQVFEKVGKSGSIRQSIASFHAVERSYGPAALSALLNLPSRSHCWVYTVPAHYELAYYPSKESQDEGVHQILIKSRHGVRLIYRTSYIMTGIGPPSPSPAGSSGADNAADSPLLGAAGAGWRSECSAVPAVSDHRTEFPKRPLRHMVSTRIEDEGIPAYQEGRQYWSH